MNGAVLFEPWWMGHSVIRILGEWCSVIENSSEWCMVYVATSVNCVDSNYELWLML